MGKLTITFNEFDRIRIPIHYCGQAGITKKFPTIVDTGSNANYLGLSHITALDYQVEKIPQFESLVAMHGITGDTSRFPRPWPNSNERIYAAYRIQLKALALDKHTIIPSPFVHVPVSFCVQNKQIRNLKFEHKNLALIGTDILRELNYGINIDDSAKPLFTFSKPTRNIPKRTEEPDRVEFHD
ncbi:MAG: hypothetical protein FWC89_05155 [Defluviitaleaceae bacterium]|nr:hypothetical protein [Defluviitaleaceae bacterium]